MGIHDDAQHANDLLFDELQEALKGGAIVAPEVREMLMLRLLGAIYRSTRGIDKRVCELEEQQAKDAPVLQVLKWAGTLLGISVLALIWSLVTGQAVMVFP